MRNEETVIEALLSVPQAGNTLDREPLPYGEIIEVEPMQIEAKRVDLVLQSRSDFEDDRLEARIFIALYVGGVLMTYQRIPEEIDD